MIDGSGEPPRGLQLNLGTLAQPHLHDTLVMANLGYFQVWLYRVLRCRLWPTLFLTNLPPLATYTAQGQPRAVAAVYPRRPLGRLV